MKGKLKTQTNTADTTAVLGEEEGASLAGDGMGDRGIKR